MRLLFALLLLLPQGLSGWYGMTPASAARSVQSAPLPEDCFVATGKCIRGLFRAYWLENGGLGRQGYPLTDEFDEVNLANGRTYRVQYFERARFEYHPEYVNTPHVVLLGQVGQEEFAARYPAGRPASPPRDGDRCFAETGRCIHRGAFLDYWERNGGLSQFGLPISDEFAEQSVFDNQTYASIYFERARFEYHPENAGTPYTVLIGLLGRQELLARYPGGPPAARTDPAINVWAAVTGAVRPEVAGLPPRVYVPDEQRGDVTVIDAVTFRIINRYPSGVTAHHVGPGPDFMKLYVNNMGSSTLLEIDARSGRPVRTIAAAVPYNLYFTTDGSKAIVAAEPINALDFYDPVSWRLLKRLSLPCSGVDHLDMSANGRYLMVSCEYDGQIFKVDTVQMVVLGSMRVGGLPVDSKLSPDGALFYVANQERHGVSVIDPVTMREIAFLPTGQGAHGMAISRDTKYLYVSNRLAGSISVIDFASGVIATTWYVGGSPDMLQVSLDGTQLWASNRFHGTVSVIDTRDGGLIATIRTGTAPHGLAYFPQPGQISIGHNGVYR